MTTPTPTPPQSTAIAAFLRGVERRAWLLARAQSGQPVAAQRALAVTQQVFVSDAEQWPIAQWPLQYWRLLLSVPAMGQATDTATDTPLPAIAQLPPAIRAAVLLHLVVCLDETEAAAALDCEVASYQQRIRDALPRDAHGQPDIAVWRQWRDAVQQALEAPDLVTPTQAAATPQASLQTPPPQATPTAASAPSTAAGSANPPPHPHRHLLRWLWLGVALGLLALVATFFLHPRGRVLWNEWHNRVRVEALPAAAAPKARFDPSDAANDPDRALFAAPQELALATDLPLLAWLSTQPDPLPEATASIPLPQWHRTNLRQTAWLRGVWGEWQALPEPERASLRSTATHFFGLPAQQQQALRQRYAAQSFDAHRGWHLGPQLGRNWPRIAALFAFIDPSEQQPIMQLLRQATPEDLDTLARLAQTTPPEHRAQLRQSLLALPANQRSAWLQARLQH